MRRSGKFYSRNEKKTLASLGLKPAPQSGGGWIVKEDGENDLVMVQLKSTDAQSYRVNMLDMKKLEYHASVSNKIPIFLVQFLKQDKIYMLMDVEMLPGLLDGMQATLNGKCGITNSQFDTMQESAQNEVRETPAFMSFEAEQRELEQIRRQAIARNVFFDNLNKKN